MIILDNISLNFGTQIVFNNLNLRITDQTRVGIVGNNGSGKTTLLRIITGELHTDTGNVDISAKQSIGYLPQENYDIENINIIKFIKDYNGITALEKKAKNLENKLAKFTDKNKEYLTISKEYEKICDLMYIKEVYSFESKTKRVLKGLGFKPSDYSMSCGEFSGGWKRRIFLANILLANPDIMILDEPTNHLDTESMEWLESYLKNYSGTLVTVSHNRRFLDKMVNQIVEVENKKVNIYKGNYSFYIHEKERKIAVLKKQMSLQKSQIKKIKEFIEKFRYKASKAKQVQERVKMLEKFDVIELEKKSKNIKINFPPCERSGYEVLTVENLSKSYGNNNVFSNVNFKIVRGERISVVGVNGAGKSTLSRIISGVENPDKGSIKYGFKVKISYFSQENSKNLNFNNSIWDEINSVDTDATPQEKRNLLGAFLFSGDEIYKPISVLSGGEKSRISLLKILLTDANLLILDEPTNHLDFNTRVIFQNALLNFEGTIIIVSHDRFFLDLLVKRVFEIKEGNISIFNGNYSEYILTREIEENYKEEIPEPPSENVNKSLAYKSKNQKRMEAENRNKLTRYRKQLKQVEKEIELHESEKIQIERSFSLTEISSDPKKIKELNFRLKEIEKIIDENYIKWEELSEILEDKK